MALLQSRFKSAVTAFLLGLATPVAVFALDEDTMAPLFEALREAEGSAADQIEQKIWDEWTKSGSAAMDLLYERGREALESGDVVLAIEHFTALIDHAPDFPEAYNARATAYYQAGLYGPSLADIRQVLLRNPRHFGALGGLALVLEEIGDLDGALAAYREVEKLHPHREGLADAINRLERASLGEDI